MIELILLSIWLMLPLGLIPAVIVLAVKNSRLKKLIPESYEQSERKLLKKDRKPISFTVLLIIGVLFIIIAGIIFSTTNWEYMSGITKAVLLVSTSLIFFTAGIISEKKLKLEKTGFAFFILGGLFLPVSVYGISYFEIMGKWFSLDGKGAYMVAAVMLAVTVPVLILSEIKYKGSVISRYVFGISTALEYIILAEATADRVYNVDYHRGLLPAVMITCGYIACIMIKSLRTVPVQTLLIAELVILSYERSQSALASAVLALGCTAVSAAVNKGVFSIISIFAVPVMIISLGHILFVFYEENGWWYNDFKYSVYTAVMLAAVSFIFDLPSFRNIIKFKWLDRTFSLAVIAMAYEILSAADYSKKYWILSCVSLCAYFAVKAFIMRVSSKDVESRLGFSLVFFFLMILLQRFNNFYLLEAEYTVAVSYTATVPLLFIWKKKRKAAEIIVFIQTIAGILFLMENTMDYGEDINAVILAGTCTLLAVFSFIRRSKKWFILSALSLVVIVLYLTSDIWKSVSWWAYLLLIGLIFIFYAASNEYYRKTGQDNQIKEKIIRVIDHVWRKC